MNRSNTSYHRCLLLVIVAIIGHSHCQSSASYLDPYEEDIDFGYSGKSYASKPQNVSLESTDSSTVMVRWEPPYGESPYGALRGYKIKYRVKGDKRHQTVDVQPNRHFFELTNLARGIVYNVKMWAVFSNGTGPQTNWISVETLQKDLEETHVPDKPMSLRALPSPNSIHVTWAAPRNKNILVKGYKIGWGKGVPDVYTQMIKGDQRSFLIDKLEPSVEYVISLRAFNRMGDGQPTYETVRTSVESNLDSYEPLLPPVGLKANVISSTAIVLDWTDTSLGEGSAASVPDNQWYLVRYSSNFHSNAPRYRYQNSSKLNCMIEDLKANTQYEFAVKVLKNKRNSTWSMSVLNTTFEAVPSTPPRDLTIVPATDDDPSTVNLHWQPPKQPNGQITSYVIFYTTDNTQQDRDWSVKVIIGDKLNDVLTGLKPAAPYYFKIQARNGKGYGPLSTEVSFNTLPDPNSISISIFLVIVVSILFLVAILLVAVIKLYLNNRDKAKNLKNRKGGYAQAATSPSGKNTNSRLNNARDLKPPDLWIHNNDQVELKSIDKNGSESPMLPMPNENSFAKIKKTNSTYGMNASLYDDLVKSPASPIDNMGIATMRRSSTIRKQASCMDQSMFNSIINLEPTTALSRPMYPKTQFQIPRTQMMLDSMDGAPNGMVQFNGNNCGMNLYDPVSAPTVHMAMVGHPHPIEPMANMHMQMGASSNNSYMSGNSSSSPHSVMSNNTVLTNSSTATNITNSSTSPPNTTIYMSNKRPPGPSLKSFGVPTPPPPLPSLATLNGYSNNSHNNYNTSLSSIGSPSKKFLLTTTNNLNSNMCGGSSSTLASNGKSVTHFSDDNSISASYNADDLNQEMANIDSIMRGLNAAKQNPC